MKTLLLVHGWGAGPRCWERQEDFFRGRVEVLTPAAPAWESRWLSDLLKTLPLANLVAVGWSLGGMMLLEALATEGLKPGGVVLMGVSPVFCRRPDHPFGPRPAAVRAMRQALRQEAGGVLRDFARQCLAAGEEARADEVAACFHPPGEVGLLASGLDYLLTRDLRLLLPQVAGPSVIIQGDQDVIVPLEQGEFLQAHLPGASLQVIPGAGHLPFVTRSDMINVVLEDVLGGLEAF